MIHHIIELSAQSVPLIQRRDRLRNSCFSRRLEKETEQPNVLITVICSKTFKSVGQLLKSATICGRHDFAHPGKLSAVSSGSRTKDSVFERNALPRRPAAARRGAASMRPTERAPIFAVRRGFRKLIVSRRCSYQCCCCCCCRRRRHGSRS